MKHRRFRIYDGPEGQTSDQEGRKVTMSLGEVFPLLADAMLSDRTWLLDFADDDIAISEDLFEVLMAYSQYRQRA